MKIKKEILKLIRYSHLLFAKKIMPNNISILFHNIEEVNLPAFIKILHYFQDLGYKTTDPYTYQKSNDEKKLFISFDDNYKNWLNISEILNKNNCQAVFYITTSVLSDKASGLILKNYFNRINYYKDDRTLSSKDIQSMVFNYNQIIGGHTVNHYDLSKISLTTAKNEILQNKNDLEEIIGEEIYHFSFPFGMRRNFNNVLREYCKEIGYESICNGIPGLLYEEIDIYDINRTGWNFNKDFKYNLDNLRIQGKLFEKITGRSAIG